MSAFGRACRTARRASEDLVHGSADPGSSLCWLLACPLSHTVTPRRTSPDLLYGPLAPTESVYHTGIAGHRKSAVVLCSVFIVPLSFCIETGAWGVRTVVALCPWLSLLPPTVFMSGHYARTGPGAGGDWGKPVLLQAHDDNKDQTYFLSAVSSSALRRVRPFGTRPLYLPS